jgi:hypothetical protein
VAVSPRQTPEERMADELARLDAVAQAALVARGEAEPLELI